MSDVFVAYDQLIDTYVAVRQERDGRWYEATDVGEDSFDDLPALSGQERYQALADVRGADRDKACARAKRMLRQRARQVAKWNDELEVFLATMAVRHEQREQELAAKLNEARKAVGLL